MGQLTIAARFSDLEKVCFKVEKMKEFSEIHNIPFSLHSIACLPSEWDFIQNTGEKKSVEELFFTLKKDIEFTCEEQKYWQHFFKEEQYV